MIELYIDGNKVTISKSWNGINVLLEDNIRINNIPEKEAREIINGLLRYFVK